MQPRDHIATICHYVDKLGKNVVHYYSGEDATLQCQLADSLKQGGSELARVIHWDTRNDWIRWSKDGEEK